MSRRERDDRDDRPSKGTERKGDKKPVIELHTNHGLTAGEAFLRRLLPAAVISAGIHLFLAVAALLLSILVPPVSAAPELKRVDVAVEEQTEEPAKENLTEVTTTIDDNVGTPTLPDVPMDVITVQAEVNKDQPAGDPSATIQQKIDSFQNVGSPSDLVSMPGLVASGPGAGTPGSGGGGIGISNPSTAGRSGATRDTLLRSGGGNSESEAAVARGIMWLARMQRADGTWAFDGKEADKDKAASTGMGLLPFLAAGQTHKPGKDNKYKDNVTAAVTALLKMQKSDGSFSENTYANSIAVVAICELFGMTGDKVLLLRPCQAAIDLIQKGQGKNGSWGYKYGDEGDTSIVGWQIQALHSAKMCKELKVDSKVLERAMKFLDTVASKPHAVRNFPGATSLSTFGYKTPAVQGSSHSLTAVGLLCRYYLNGWGPNSGGFRDGTDFLLAIHPPEKEFEYDMYYYYYATQVLHYRDGDEWHKQWNPKMRDMLLSRQVKNANRPNVDGSWDPDDSRIGSNCGRLGTTAMCLLTLEVYYRHLPLYGRGTGGLNELDRK